MTLLKVGRTEKLFRPMTFLIWQAAALMDDFSPLQLFHSEVFVPTYSVTLKQHCANMLKSKKRGQLKWDCKETTSTALYI